MLSGFDTAFAHEKELVSNFWANEKFDHSPASHCDGLDRQIDAPVFDLYRLVPVEIKIVEGATK